MPSETLPFIFSHEFHSLKHSDFLVIFKVMFFQRVTTHYSAGLPAFESILFQNLFLNKQICAENKWKLLLFLVFYIPATQAVFSQSGSDLKLWV